MNFLSKTFSSLTGTSIPYTIKEKVADPSTNHGVWTVYNGVNPKDSSPVSIFEFYLRDPTNIQRGWDRLAKNAFKKLKLIKLPGIISIIDFIENENYLYIVSEAVVPLATYMQQELSQDTKLFGIYNLAHTLLFINTKCTCLHGFIQFGSVYVNALGDWKLFGFELLTNLSSDPDQPIYRLSDAMPGFRDVLPEEVKDNGIDGIRQFPVKFDSYCFGIFIYKVLAPKDFVVSSNIVDQTVFKPLSARLKNAINKLYNQKVNLRITIEKFVQETESILEENPIIAFNKQLEEIKFKNDQEKLEFFKYELSSYIGDDSEENKFPPGLLDYKLLPELISQYNSLSNIKPTINTTPLEVQQKQETLSIILNYILQFGIKLEVTQFNRMVKPIVLDAFGQADRSIRLTLLTHLSSFEKFLNDSEVQLKVFYNLIGGFQDTNFMIRESTLKSITVIIDKVSVKQVNQDLLKVLAKSQMDPKPSIRVNTLVLIIKISSKIYKTSKNNVLITALSKSLRDTFTPCKMMALSGFESLIDQFSLEEICSKILGHLAISLMDNRSGKVRKEAKRIFQLYLNSVEKHASSLPDDTGDEEDEEAEFFRKNAPSQELKQEIEVSTTPSEGFSFGWGMVNKFVSTSGVQGELNNEFNASTPDLTRVGTPTTEPLQHTSEKPSGISWDPESIEDDFDGWNMNDDSNVLPVQIKKLNISEKPKPARKSQINSQSKHSLSNRKTSTLKLGTKTLTKSPGSSLKLNLVDDEVDDGWGDGDTW